MPTMREGDLDRPPHRPHSAGARPCKDCPRASHALHALATFGRRPHRSRGARARRLPTRRFTWANTSRRASTGLYGHAPPRRPRARARAGSRPARWRRRAVARAAPLRRGQRSGCVGHPAVPRPRPQAPGAHGRFVERFRTEVPGPRPRIRRPPAAWPKAWRQRASDAMDSGADWRGHAA